MKDYITVIAAGAAGVFTLITAVLAWKLKSATEERDRKFAKSKERRAELKQLYTDISVVLELAIKAIRAHEKLTIEKEISEANARVRLLASDTVVDKYQKVANLLADWVGMFHLASPNRMKVGDQDVEILQAPDPKVKYRPVEKELFERLQGAIRDLTQEMRADLAKIDA